MNQATSALPHSAPLDQIDFSDPNLLRDDTWHRYFARLRDESPVHYQAESPFGPFWSITRFDDIVAVDSELGRAGGGPPAASENNMDHFCLQIENVPEQQLRDWLTSHGIDSGEFEVRYGAEGYGASVYVRDPDGNTLELRCVKD